MKGAATFAAPSPPSSLSGSSRWLRRSRLSKPKALVLRLGEPVARRGLITTPGLHFKYPFVENVVFLDNRILVVEAPKQEVLASDNNRLDVDSFLRLQQRYEP